MPNGMDAFAVGADRQVAGAAGIAGIAGIESGVIFPRYPRYRGSKVCVQVSSRERKCLLINICLLINERNPSNI